MKYTLSLGGVGCDTRIFKISELEHKALKERGVESDLLGYEEVCNIMQSDLFFSDFDDFIIGPFLNKNCISVKDEDENIVYLGEIPSDIQKHIASVDECKNALFLEDRVKGWFFTFEIDEAFNMEDLELVTKLLYPDAPVIVGIKHKGILLENKDYTQDLDSLGIYYLLKD